MSNSKPPLHDSFAPSHLATMVPRKAPQWAWDIIDDTLQRKAMGHGLQFTPDQIHQALKAMMHFTERAKS